MEKKGFICNELPKKIILELTSKCNLNCQMCITHSYLHKSSSNFKEMDPEIIKKIIPFIKGLESLELGGVGEPLVARNFSKAIYEFRRINPALKIILFTNGIMLKNKTIREVVLNNIDYVQIALNGMGNSYEENMLGSSWKEIQKILVMLKNENKKAWIALGYIVMRNNWKQLFRLLLFAKANNIQEIALKDLWVTFPQLNEQSIRKSFFLETLVFLILGLLYIGAFILKIKLTTVDLPFRFPFFRKFLLNECTAPWEQIQVNTKGEVLLCCNGRTVAGNLHKHSLPRIWNSSKAVNYRQGLVEKKYYKECKNCKIVLGRTIKTLEKNY